MFFFSKLKSSIHRLGSFYEATKSIKDSFRLLLLSWHRKKRLEISIGGNRFFLRDNKIDLEVFLATFRDKHHKSPFVLPETPVILDLGSNIGLTLIDFRNDYPDSRLYGVELDPANYALLLENVKGLSDCQVVNAGVWKEDGEIFYEDIDAQSFRIEGAVF